VVTAGFAPNIVGLVLKSPNVRRTIACSVKEVTILLAEVITVITKYLETVFYPNVMDILLKIQVDQWKFGKNPQITT
jgi:hypothetical protein